MYRFDPSWAFEFALLKKNKKNQEAVLMLLYENIIFIIQQPMIFNTQITQESLYSCYH